MKKRRLLAGASESTVITGIPAAIALSMLSLSSGGIGDSQQNAGGFLLHRLIERVALGFRIVAVAAR